MGYQPEQRPPWQQPFPQSMSGWQVDALRLQQQIDEASALQYELNKHPQPESVRPVQTAIAVSAHTPWSFVGRGRAIIWIDGTRVPLARFAGEDVVPVESGDHLVRASYRIFPHVVRGIGNCSLRVDVRQLETVDISYDVKIRWWRYLFLPFALLVPRLLYRATLNITKRS